MKYFSVHIVLAPKLSDQASAILIDEGASGLEVRDESTLTASSTGTVEVIGWFDTRAAADAADHRVRSMLGPTAKVHVMNVVDPGWREAWRAYFRPMRFGRRLWVTPPDEDPPAITPASAEPDIAVVRLVPSGAFGTGTHESTALMLELLDELVTPQVTVLDVGCGSGILAMAAARLGAEDVWGVDIDAEAIVYAKKNSKTNDLDGQCRFDETPLETITEEFQLVLANLSAPVLVRERERLARLVKPMGWLLWSGLLEEDLEEVGAPPGLVLVEDRRRNGWVAQAWKR